jgi:hypothetical protein
MTGLLKAGERGLAHDRPEQYASNPGTDQQYREQHLGFGSDASLSR